MLRVDGLPELETDHADDGNEWHNVRSTAKEGEASPQRLILKGYHCGVRP